MSNNKDQKLYHFQQKNESYQQKHLNHKTTSSSKDNYIISKQFYNEKKLKKSIHSLHKEIQNRKYLNSLLATKILFSHGKHEQIMFKYRTKQIFGDRITFSKNNKIRNNGINSVHQSVNNYKDNANLSRWQQFKPIFLSHQKHFVSREERRKSLGIQEADITNYENKKKGIQTKLLRKALKQKKHIDFNLVNVKGFAAKISASLTKINRGKISTLYLTKMMNLNQGKQNLNFKTLRHKRG